MLKLYQEACEILKLFHKAEMALLKLDFSSQSNEVIPHCLPGRSSSRAVALAKANSVGWMRDLDLRVKPEDDVQSALWNTTYEEKQFMQTKRIIKLVIRDFIDQEIFTLNGLAHELGVPLDSLSELYISEQREPSCSVAIKLLQLHAQMFPALYV